MPDWPVQVGPLISATLGQHLKHFLNPEEVGAGAQPPIRPQFRRCNPLGVVIPFSPTPSVGAPLPIPQYSIPQPRVGRSRTGDARTWVRGQKAPEDWRTVKSAFSVGQVAVSLSKKFWFF